MQDNNEEKKALAEIQKRALARARERLCALVENDDESSAAYLRRKQWREEYYRDQQWKRIYGH